MRSCSIWFARLMSFWRGKSAHPWARSLKRGPPSIGQQPWPSDFQCILPRSAVFYRVQYRKWQGLRGPLPLREVLLAAATSVGCPSLLPDSSSTDSFRRGAGKLRSFRSTGQPRAAVPTYPLPAPVKSLVLLTGLLISTRKSASVAEVKRNLSETIAKE